MSSPIYNALGGMQMGGPGNILQEFQQFRQQMQGKDPAQEINKLLQSGRINQSQLNQAQQMAMHMQSLFRSVH